MLRSPHVILAAAMAAVLSASASAQRNDTHWGYWRGPAGTGVAPGAAPTTWNDTTNVAWKVEIPGRGHSSPVVWQDRVFVTTAVPTGRTLPPPDAAGGGRGRNFGDGGAAAFEEHRFEALALDRESGAVAWRRVATTAAPHEGYHHMYGSFASNSPLTDGERVYASFGSRGVYAFDMDGTPVWQRDFGVQMRMFLQFGEGVGPVLEDGRLILLFDHDGDSFITMLDAATGRDIWRTARSEGTNWSAPLVVTHAGRKQIVVGAPGKVRAYEFETGRPVWEAAGLGMNTIPRPVQHDDLVLVMSGFRNPALMAIRLGREGDLTGTDAIVWTANRGLSYTASPVLHEERLYFVTDTGMMSSLDARTGTPVYQQVRLPKPYNIKASPVAAGGKLYVATEEGDVLLADLGTASFDVTATNTLADQSFVASPAVADGDLYLRSRTHLFRISDRR